MTNEIIIEKLKKLIVGWVESAESKERTAYALYSRESMEYKSLQFAATTQYNCSLDLQALIVELQNKRLNNDN